jgi:ABC-type branched-subunit amino acid transport system substrate-binding protein
MKYFFAIIFLLASSVNLFAQNQKPVKVAIVCPLYIDSAFNGTNYKLGSSNLPRNILPGLDFYNGVMMAVDSLQAEKANIEVLIFDSKSIADPMSKLLVKPIWDSVSLIIASFNTRSEVKPWADLALKKKIPLISETYPNDGGVTNNPYFILINSTLRTHCEALYKHLQRNYSTTNLVLVRRKGAVEEYIQSVFGDMGKATKSIPLNYKTVELPDSFSSKELLSFIDSNKRNTVICGTTNETFGIKLVKILDANKNYSAVAVGMPTWDGLRELSATVGIDKAVDIVYSTPYNFNRNEKLGTFLVNAYHDRYFARPSDWVFKGYESMYHFTKLFLKYDSSFRDHLSDKDYHLFNDFDIQPVRLNKDGKVIDHWENKKIYFFKRKDGVVGIVN